MQPPHTQGKVQSAVRLALYGIYLLQASALTGLIDRQMTSNLPSASILPIMTGLERRRVVFMTSSKPLGAFTLCPYIAWRTALTSAVPACATACAHILKPT